MHKLIKQEPPEIVECAIYKEFPFETLLILILFWVGIFMLFSITSPQKNFSVKEALIGGIIAGLLYHLPSYFSALLMRLLQKPILVFNAQGFSYTPQPWSIKKLHEWEAVHAVDIYKKQNNEEKSYLMIYLHDGKTISIQEHNLPIYSDQLLRIFRYRLKNVPINKLLHESSKELIVYHKFPDYRVWAVSVCAGILSGIGFLGSTGTRWAAYSIGVFAILGLLQQLHAFKKRNSPLLIISKRGLWYAGIWFKQGIFRPWHDIKSLEFSTQIYNFLSVAKITVRSYSHFSVIIMPWLLDIDYRTLRAVMQRFQAESAAKKR